MERQLFQWLSVMKTRGIWTANTIFIIMQWVYVMWLTYILLWGAFSAGKTTTCYGSMEVATFDTLGNEQITGTIYTWDGYRCENSSQSWYVCGQKSTIVTIRSPWPLAIGTIVYAQVSHHLVHIMSMLHNVRCTTRFWNNLHDISSKSQKNERPCNSKIFWRNKCKVAIQDN